MEDVREHQVSVLEGSALDYAAAVAMEMRVGYLDGDTSKMAVQLQDGRVKLICGRAMDYIRNGVWHPSSDWDIAGPLLVKAGVGLRFDGDVAVASVGELEFTESRERVLVAAVRCLVTSRIGPVIEIPESVARRGLVKKPSM